MSCAPAKGARLKVVALRALSSGARSLLSGGSLQARSARAVTILTLGYGFERAIRFVRTMILARILAREEFGLMAIVMAAIVAFQALTEVGVRQSIIHNKIGDQARYLNVAWWFQMTRGVCLFALAYVAAPWVSRFYDDARLLPLIRMALLALLFGGAISPGVAVLEKKMQFNRWVLLVQGSGLVGTLSTLAVAFFVRADAWALVTGFVIESAIQCVFSFIVCPFLPRPTLDSQSLLAVLKYAKGMFALPILMVVSLQADIFVLGKLVSKEQLGMYSLALTLAQQPMYLLLTIVGRVLLPAFAEKQDDKRALRRAILKTTRVSLMVGLPVTAVLVALAQPILGIAYGRPYMAVALPFAILAVAMLMRMQGALLSNVYLAIGTPELQRRYTIALVIFIVSLIYPATVFFGLSGCASVLLVSYGAALCMQVLWMKRFTGLSFRDYVSCWVPHKVAIDDVGS
jgi:lipopolysaccharide exporter